MKAKLWCCIGTNFKGPYYDWTSLSTTRTASIGKFTTNSQRTWQWFKRRGWACIKVEMTLTPITPLKD